MKFVIGLQIAELQGVGGFHLQAIIDSEKPSPFDVKFQTTAH